LVYLIVKGIKETLFKLSTPQEVMRSIPKHHEHVPLGGSSGVQTSNRDS
jgi:hypothetical protein